jgi:nucleotide-binding universal stress UspA family protein
MPAPYRRIACCIDGDPSAERVLAEALALRGPDTGEVFAVHVVSIPHTLVMGPFAYVEPLSVVRARAEEWIGERLAGTSGVTPVFLEGYPPRAVCDWAAANGVDLVVAAAHRGLVDRAMLGGFASYLAYHAPCPVLLVRPVPVPVPD